MTPKQSDAQQLAIDRRVRELLATAKPITPAQASRLALLLQRPTTEAVA